MSSTTPSSFDTLVLGGGIMGASAAYALAGRGQRVALVERFAPGHAWGSSHGDGRIIRYTYPEAEYVEMASLAFAAWRQLEEESGTVLTFITGGWECGPADSPELADLESSFSRFSVPYESWDAAESARHFPQLRLPEGSRALFQKDGGIVRADRAVATLWRLAEQRGAVLRPGTQVTHIEPRASSVVLRTTDGNSFQGDHLVLAGGAWTATMAAGLGLDLPLTVTREHVAYFPRRSGGTLDHGLGGLPTVIDFHTPQPFYALPQIDVPGVKVGWHHSGPQVAPEALIDASGETALGEDADALAAARAIGAQQRAFVERRFSELQGEPSKVVPCLYTNTPDHHFLIDRHPQWPQIVLACGFSGHGFKFGPVVGRLVADLVQANPPPVDLSLFALKGRSERQMPRRGA